MLPINIVVLLQNVIYWLLVLHVQYSAMCDHMNGISISN